MIARLSKIMTKEDDLEKGMEYDQESDKEDDQKMIREMNKDVLPPRDTSPFVVISIERCSMTGRSPKGGDELEQADLAQGSILENQAPAWIDR